MSTILCCSNETINILSVLIQQVAVFHQLLKALHILYGKTYFKLRIEEHKLLVLPIEAAQTSAIFRSIVIGSNTMTGNVTIDVTSEPIYFCIICQ